MGESLIDAACGKYINSENTGNKTDLQNAIQGLGRAWASLPIVIQGKKVKINGKWQWVNGDTVGDIDSGTGKKAYYTNSANNGGEVTSFKPLGIVNDGTNKGVNELLSVLFLILQPLAGVL